jgi:hypothetical protein
MQAGLQVGKLRIVEMLVGVGAQENDLAGRERVVDLFQRRDDVVPRDELGGLLVGEVETDAGAVAPFQRDLLDRLRRLALAGASTCVPPCAESVTRSCASAIPSG